MCGSSEAVERKSERMDTAYSPRLHELSATAERILLRMVESELEDLEYGWLSRNRSWIRHEGWLSRGCTDG